MPKGVFITLEGGEGSGKTTQIQWLSRAFTTAGQECLTTREPGGTPSAEKLRTLLVEEGLEWSGETETLLFYAARVEHLTRLIRPALAAGKVLLCDRFSDSTRVYQGIGKGVSINFIDPLHRICLGDFAPDLTLILDIAPAVGLKRAYARHGAETKFEQLDLAFHERVREGFLSIALEEPERCVVIHAEQALGKVQRDIIQAVNQRLGFSLNPVSS